MCLRVTICAELDAALAQAAETKSGVYIEVLTDAYEASDLAIRLHDAMQAVYAA
ncbi:MAG: hypothetical protein AB7F74_08985 [Parvibaculaceae bacterium]